MANPAQTVTQLAAAYAEDVQRRFRKGGEATPHAQNSARAAQLLVMSGLADVPPQDFGPLTLKAFQQWLASDPAGRWSRATVNRYTQFIVRMFKWGASEEMVSADIHKRLETVEGLRKNEQVAAGKVLREPRPVRAVDETRILEVIERCDRHHPMLGAMIRVQYETAMRPVELLTMRMQSASGEKLIVPFPKDERVKMYVPLEEGTKLDHLRVVRVIMIGPRTWSAVEQWLPEDPSHYIWSPAKATAARNEIRRQLRKNPSWASHDQALRRAKQHADGVTPMAHAERYKKDAYRRAVHLACDQTFDPDKVRRKKGDTSYRFNPNQLRHSAATDISIDLSEDDARAVLGHSTIGMTRTYLHGDAVRAAEVALRRG